MYQQTHFDEEEEKLLLLLQGGSQYAFQLLYNKHKNRIYKVAMEHLKSPVMAQEVVQDVFLMLWSKREQIKPELRVEGWLFIVARNNIVNRIKRLATEWKATNELKITYDDIDDSLQEKMQRVDYSGVINQALSSLSEMQRKVYLMAKQDDLSYLEIAQLLNISPLTVKTHMARALSQIRDFSIKLKLISVILFVILFNGHL